MKILVTGGAGYIGSHTIVELLQAGFEVVALDNLSNSKLESLRRVRQITGKAVEFHQVDLLERDRVMKIFAEAGVDAVIHFAGLKAVGESVRIPLRYYHNNVTGTLILCEAMAAASCHHLVFSSSATVYGDPASVPIGEDFPLSATNPYGRTKLHLEQILQDLQIADPQFNVALLRYFNPVGAHPSGLIGEDPSGVPDNLVPYISQVAIGKRGELSVFGSDYPTRDGTGVRDYIHVVDLALGHVRALEKLRTNPGLVTYNLGTGEGYTVLEMVAAFEKASGRRIAIRQAPRRQGDVASCYANSSKAASELGWKATRGVEEMCVDTWRWQSQNPDGYASEKPSNT